MFSLKTLLYNEAATEEEERYMDSGAGARAEILYTVNDGQIQFSKKRCKDDNQDVLKESYNLSVSKCHTLSLTHFSMLLYLSLFHVSDFIIQISPINCKTSCKAALHLI